MENTYIPMPRGFVYLVAVVDWFSRRVLAWRLSIILETEFCLDAVSEALARYGKPAIFNTDQGSQFTSVAFTGLLLAQDIAISMDGRGGWLDRVFVERLWRSVKYEAAYLRDYDSVSDARASLGRHLDFCNARPPHSSLGARTPEQAYLSHLPQRTGSVPPVPLRPGYVHPARHHGAGKTCVSTGRRSTYRNCCSEVPSHL